MQSVNTAYRLHLSQIMNNGKTSSPRGVYTTELEDQQFFCDMSNPVITSKKRKLGYRFAVREPWWILSGSNRLSDIADFGRMAQFSDDQLFMRGAYGPKVVDQLPWVAETLINDQDSRQAVLTIWRERPSPSKDIPCTVSLQFRLRDGRINCTANMRSSDAWLGLPYDIIFFSLCSAYLVTIMRNSSPARIFDYVSLGRLCVNAGSSHIYGKNIPQAREVVLEENGSTSAADFNVLLALKPDDFLQKLEDVSVDEDGAGILDVSRVLF